MKLPKHAFCQALRPSWRRGWCVRDSWASWTVKSPDHPLPYMERSCSWSIGVRSDKISSVNTGDSIWVIFMLSSGPFSLIDLALLRTLLRGDLWALASTKSSNTSWFPAPSRWSNYNDVRSRALVFAVSSECTIDSLVGEGPGTKLGLNYVFPSVCLVSEHFVWLLCK